MKYKKIAIAVALAGVTIPAMATNGSFSHGYGMKSKGMAGVGAALPQDSLAAATNPAGMVEVGDRLDVGVDWFRPIRSSDGTGGVAGSFDASGRKNFYIPEFGYNRMLSKDMSVGLSVYGNGGMNTTYKGTSPFRPVLGGDATSGIDMMQLFITPSLAYRMTDDVSVGGAINVAYQRFSADGLSPFGANSIDRNRLFGNGEDSSVGWGFRMGWLAKLRPDLSLGIAYQSRTWMGKLKKYSGLFAEQGDFDIPASLTVGLSWKATPALTLAADVQQIYYKDVAAIGNPIANLLAGNNLGSDNGGGFGWKDQTVLKLGLSYEMSKALTLRGGFSHGTQVIPKNETMFNMLAPGVVQDHLTLGATWSVTPRDEITLAYMHAFKKRVMGSNSVPAAWGGGEANLQMKQDSLGIAYGFKY